MEGNMVEFGKNFVFGVATSSYQIEGATAEDGRTPSIWDEFCKIPGKVYKGQNGDVTCDHYHRYKEDVRLMKEIGVDSYSFSIAWSRIFPDYQKYNEKGMEFYKKLIDELRKNDIEPAVTLYHWDLPLWAYNRGGWLSRDSVKWFQDYATKVFKELNASVKIWVTHCEPFCSSMLGYCFGIHAPGHKNLREALTAAHHILLSHGLAVESFRDLSFSESNIGIKINLTPSYPASNSKEDVEASYRSDGLANRWFLDPIFKSSYPEDMKKIYSNLVGALDFIKDGDLEKISSKIDFLGLNYYTRVLTKFVQDSKINYQDFPGNLKKTEMGWEICPEVFYDLILRLRKEYTRIPIYITENGAAFDDFLTEEKRIHDTERIDYVRRHLEKIAELNGQGADIRGYFLWSLLDNFEWAYGYSKRFGILYVDYNTQDRIFKDSALWYREVIQNRAIS